MEACRETRQVLTNMAYIVKAGDKEYVIEIKKQADGLKIQVNGKGVDIEIHNTGMASDMVLLVNNRPFSLSFRPDQIVMVDGEEYAVEVVDEAVQRLIKANPEAVHKKELTISAPMPGLVVDIGVKEGDVVKQEQGLLTVEAMKMQNEMKSPRDGVVKKILVQKGQTVNSKDALIVID